jgi:hypothetical protein
VAWVVVHRLAGSDERSTVSGTVRAWSGAIADQDGVRACAMMAASARTQLTAAVQPARDCPGAVRELATALGPSARDQLRMVPVQDVSFPASNRAVVTLGTASAHLELRRVAGRWLISDLGTTVTTTGGGAYPPGPITVTPPG